MMAPEVYRSPPATVTTRQGRNLTNDLGKGKDRGPAEHDVERVAEQVEHGDPHLFQCNAQGRAYPHGGEDPDSPCPMECEDPEGRVRARDKDEDHGVVEALHSLERRRRPAKAISL
jgi:hypothetical protein